MVAQRISGQKNQPLGAPFPSPLDGGGDDDADEGMHTSIRDDDTAFSSGEETTTADVVDPLITAHETSLGRHSLRTERVSDLKTTTSNDSLCLAWGGTLRIHTHCRAGRGALASTVGQPATRSSLPPHALREGLPRGSCAITMQLMELAQSWSGRQGVHSEPSL